MAHMTGGDFARPAREARHAVAALVGAAFHPAQAAGAAATQVGYRFGMLASGVVQDAGYNLATGIAAMTLKVK